MESNVYIPDYGPMMVQTPVTRWQKIKKLGKSVGIILAVAGILFGMNIYKDSKVYQKPSNWVISQGLNSTLTKQQLLLNSAKNGQVSLDDLVKAATASTTVKAEAVKIGNDYLLSTGADGKVEVEIDPGSYKVELIKIDRVDFTGIPGTISIGNGNYILNIGLIKGKGKVRTGDDLAGQHSSDLRGRIIISLFQDKNGNGIKDENEPDLPWAGVTLKLRFVN